MLSKTSPTQQNNNPNSRFSHPNRSATAASSLTTADTAKLSLLSSQVLPNTDLSLPKSHVTGLTNNNKMSQPSSSRSTTISAPTGFHGQPSPREPSQDVREQSHGHQRSETMTAPTPENSSCIGSNSNLVAMLFAAAIIYNTNPPNTLSTMNNTATILEKQSLPSQLQKLQKPNLDPIPSTQTRTQETNFQAQTRNKQPFSIMSSKPIH